MNNDLFLWLMRWYDSQTDGDWEHSHGVHFTALDNPGWDIRIGIEETELEEKEFEKLLIERSENDWLFCIVSKGIFKANCGLFNLPEVLKIFREWVEDIPIREWHINPHLEWLIQWFQSNCNGEWERFYGVRIDTLDNPGWYLKISLQDTPYGGKPFEKIIQEKSENDWVHCFIREGTFQGACGPLNLIEVLEIFHDWVESIHAQWA
jgi:hypothetical protein